MKKRCFEQSKQPHSLTCRRYFHQSNNNYIKESNNSYSAMARSPKGQLSEYQAAFLNAQEKSHSKVNTNNRLKDSIDLFSYNGKHNEFPNESFPNNEPKITIRRFHST
jgi:hypothetical protein